MIAKTSRRMNASVTNQIMPKHSLETSATISKLTYFGHVMHRSDSVKKRYDIRTDRWQWKIRKIVYKMISRNLRTSEVELVQHLNTFTAIVDLSRFNNSCLKSPASTLVDLTFQSRALHSALSA